MILIYFGGFRTLAVPLRTLRATHSLVFKSLGAYGGLEPAVPLRTLRATHGLQVFQSMEAWADPRKQKKKTSQWTWIRGTREKVSKDLSLLGVHFDSSNIDDDTSSASVS